MTKYTTPQNIWGKKQQSCIAVLAHLQLGAFAEGALLLAKGDQRPNAEIRKEEKKEWQMNEMAKRPRKATVSCLLQGNRQKEGPLHREENRIPIPPQW